MIFACRVLTVYVVLLRAKGKATLETKVTIFDQSKSQYCLSGLLPGYDKIQLEIHVVSREVNVVRIFLNSTVLQCFCSFNVDHVYHLTVNVTAQLEFSRGFMLAVLSPTANYDDTLLLGRRIQLKKFYVKGSESATLLYEGVDLLADKCSNNFTVISDKTLTFCMYDIDHPAISLFVNSNHTQTSMSGDCLKSKVRLEAGSNHLVYSYIDSCRRRGSYECTIWSSTIAIVNITVTPDTIEEIDLTEGWTFIWHILLAMVVVNVVFILYCYKIGACCFNDCGDDIPLIIFQDVSQGEGRLQPKEAVVQYSSSLGASSVSDSVDPVFKHVLKIKLNSSRSDIIIGKR
ncbi:uncharacterized protein LOC106058312 isoform X2 [Biomphalaria glabrata]|uniref:Uncharacterized protein LOC106058312 isoform X2 n=1 Tax=Biomphalaria glabrata TaxID=6526 RepID=A0A9W3AJC5_BIOGL|nr:uncharacterized protein LOC106058312 isoform X2 [Biomphalaria glabrata]